MMASLTSRLILNEMIIPHELFHLDVRVIFATAHISNHISVLEVVCLQPHDGPSVLH